MSNAAANIAALVSAGHGVGELEAALGLSAGYLSKVRHGAVRPSAQLVALLEVVRVHPETLATVTRATRRRAPPKRTAVPVLAMDRLPAFAAALSGARWALAGRAAMRLSGVPMPAEPGLDVIVDDADRHVLEALRRAGYPAVLRTPGLAVCHLDGAHPNESLRVHFPVLPPLTGAYARAVPVDVGGTLVPVVDRLTLTLAELLSQRQGAEQAVVAAVHGGVDPVDLARELAALAAWPEVRSPYVLRTFDRKLARERLDRSARAA